MVGTILARVLSRTNLSTSTTNRKPVNELLNNSPSEAPTSKIPTDTKASHPTLSEMADKQQSILLEDDIQRSSSTRASATRKQSYASVKEDTDIPQSFISRRRSSRRDSQAFINKPSLCAFNDSDVSDCIRYDTSAILDSEEEEPTSASATDSIASPPRRVANLESLPDEILDLIFSRLTIEVGKDRLVDPKVDVFNLLFVSRAVHAAALRVLYRHVRIPQSKAFFKFHNALAHDNHLGNLVQCLDLSHNWRIGFGRARSATVEMPYLTPTTLSACLDRMANVKALLAHEHIDDELDSEVLTRIFEMPSLRILDLCSCSSQPFTSALTLVSKNFGNFLSIERLSLHECTTLKAPVFEAMLPKLHRLTHLDLAHTMVNDAALMSIPHTARITHLNLERCTQITGDETVKFLTTHPAVMHSTVYLNLMADASRYRLLTENNVTDLLPQLPTTLRSLNLGGARVNGTHVSALRKLATHLEELGLKGANLSLNQEVMHILSQVSTDCNAELQHPEWRHSLRYLDLTDIKTVNQMSLTYSPTAIIRPETMPLEVIEVSESVMKDIQTRNKKIKDPEWVAQEFGRRNWYVRNPHHPTIKKADKIEDGYRGWKMGARWWGMRKIPMFEQEVGGMYGYFMFKRA